MNRITSASESGEGTGWTQSYSYSGQHGNLIQSGDVPAASLACGNYNAATNQSRSPRNFIRFIFTGLPGRWPLK